MNNEPQQDWKNINRQLRRSGIAVLLIATMPSAWAVSFNSTYPYTLEPGLATAAVAEPRLSELSWILRPLRAAHQQSVQRGWKSVAPAQASAEYNTPIKPLIGEQ